MFENRLGASTSFSVYLKIHVCVSFENIKKHVGFCWCCSLCDSLGEFLELSGGLYENPKEMWSLGGALEAVKRPEGKNGRPKSTVKTHVF